MEHLVKILEGTGTLTMGCGEKGETDYNISVVVRDDAHRRAYGMIVADPFLLQSASDTRDATLRTSEGTILELSFENVHEATNSADVVVKNIPR